MARPETRTTVQITADQIDMDLHRLAGRIDQLAEMVSRGKPLINFELVRAAAAVASARSAVRSHMDPRDVVRTA